MKRKYKILIGLFIGLFIISTFSNVKGTDYSDLFSNYQNDNSTININYGSLIEYATSSNNYRTYLDDSIKAIDINYDDMIDFSNTVDYSNYISQQTVLNYDNDSFKETNGNFSATYSFDDSIGSHPLGFTLYGTPTGSVNYQYDYHLSVCQVSSNSGYEGYYQTVPSKNYGSIEFFVNLAQTNIRHRIELSDGNLVAHGFNIDFYSDGYLKANILGGGYSNIIQYSANTWYHIRIDFSHSSGYLGLGDNTYVVYVNGKMYGSYAFMTNIAITKIGFYSNNGATMYIDALGYSWQNYELGSNVISQYKEVNYDSISLNLENTFSSLNTNQMCADIYDDKMYIVDNTQEKLYVYDLYTFNLLAFYSDSILADCYGMTINDDNDTLVLEIVDIFSYIDIYFYDFNFNLLGIKQNVDTFDLFTNIVYHNGYYYIAHIIVFKFDSDFNLVAYINTNYLVSSIDFLNDYMCVLSYENDSIVFYDENLEYINNTIELTDVKDFVIYGLRLYTIYYSTNQVKQYAIEIKNTDKIITQEFKFYSSAGPLTGKLVVNINTINRFHTCNFISIKFYLYVYSGSFNLITSANKEINLVVRNYSIEFETVCFIGYNNNFKVLKYGIFYEGILYDFEHFYYGSYPFYKILYSFTYSQDNANFNFFKNDIYGYRVIGCLDLNQKFTSFLDFGYFNSTLNIVQYVEPINDISKYDVNWKYTGFTIDFDSNKTISTIHFSFDFPIISINTITMYHQFNLLHYRSKAWYDVFTNALVWLLNNLWTFFNLLLFYCLILPLNYVIIYVFLCLALILVWNVLLFGLVYAGIWFLEGLYLLFFSFLPVLFEWFFYSLLPIIFDILAIVISTVISGFIYLFTFGQIPYDLIYETVLLVVSMILDFIYAIIIYVIEILPYIALYLASYLLILGMLFGKMFYFSAKGWDVNKNEVEQNIKGYTYILSQVINITRKGKQTVLV